MQETLTDPHCRYLIQLAAKEGFRSPLLFQDNNIVSTSEKRQSIVTSRRYDRAIQAKKYMKKRKNEIKWIRERNNYLLIDIKIDDDDEKVLMIISKEQLITNIDNKFIKNKMPLLPRSTALNIALKDQLHDFLRNNYNE